MFSRLSNLYLNTGSLTFVPSLLTSLLYSLSNKLPDFCLFMFIVGGFLYIFSQTKADKNFRTENREEEIQVLRTIIEEKKLNFNADLSIKYTPVEATEKHKCMDCGHSNKEYIPSPSNKGAEATFRFTYSKDEIYKLLSSFSSKQVRSNFSIENIMEYFAN